MKFNEFKDKLSTDKAFKNKFIGILVTCVVVIAIAVIVPVSVHSNNVKKAEEASRVAAELETVTVAAEEQTEAQVVEEVPSTEVAAETPAEGNAQEQAQAAEQTPEAGNQAAQTTKAAQQTQKAQTTKAPSTTKKVTQQNNNDGQPEPTKAQTTVKPSGNSAVDALKANMTSFQLKYYERVPYNVQVSIAKAVGTDGAVARSAAAAYMTDAQLAANPTSYCPTCGRPDGSGSHGTCVRVMMTMICPICGKTAYPNTCHHCDI